MTNHTQKACETRDNETGMSHTPSESAVDAVRDYIRRQKEHHRTRTFEAEYTQLLRRHKVEFDERYLWE